MDAHESGRVYVCSEDCSLCSRRGKTGQPIPYRTWVSHREKMEGRRFKRKRTDEVDEGIIRGTDINEVAGPEVEDEAEIEIQIVCIAKNLLLLLIHTFDTWE